MSLPGIVTLIEEYSIDEKAQCCENTCQAGSCDSECQTSWGDPPGVCCDSCVESCDCANCQSCERCESSCVCVG